MFQDQLQAMRALIKGLLAYCGAKDLCEEQMRCPDGSDEFQASWLTPGYDLCGDTLRECTNDDQIAVSGSSPCSHQHEPYSCRSHFIPITV